MAIAEWNGVVLAEAENDRCEIVEGNVYFPPDTIKREYFKDSSRHTFCFWKGTASYYDLEVDGKVNAGGAWYYPDPSDAARQIKDYVAFWQGVRVMR
jgi:uncharacterized protein (DUF427 family)